jgi:hypothetical protein
MGCVFGERASEQILVIHNVQYFIDLIPHTSD